MSRPQPLPGWAKAFAMFAGVAALALIVYGAWPRWRTEQIGVASVRGARIELGLASCPGRDQRVDVDEDDERVTLTVELYDDALSAEDCDGTSVRAELAAPLGDRTLVDGSDSTELPCAPPEADGSRQCERASPP